MARSRIIKPGFFKNDELASCNPLARILFSGLWTMADRVGRLEDRPTRIKAEILPYDKCNLDKLLDELHDKKFIIRYEVEGKRFMQIVNFAAHQRPHPNEPKSDIPKPTQERSVNVTTTAENVTTTAENVTSPNVGDVARCALPSLPSFTPSILPVSAETVRTEPLSADSPPSDSPVEKPIITFPTNGKIKLWDFTELFCAELTAAFPSLDVAAEARKAFAWINANTDKKKTTRGMKAFLFRWMDRATNSHTSRAPPSPNGVAEETIREKVERIMKNDK